MRVVVVVVLAAALAGCATATAPSQQPVQQQPVYKAAEPHTIAAEIKQRPRHHNRAGRGDKAEVNATKATPHSSGVDAETAAKIKAVVSAKLGNPAAIAFQDIEAGEAAGSFCGVAQVKGASGEAREMPFVVQGSQVYIINGGDDRSAAAAIHRMCDR
jgi:hypothetical protein